MPKRRTKKEKVKPNYSFLFNSKSFQLTINENLVKSHLKQKTKMKVKEDKTKENALNKESQNNSNLIKKNILKSLSLTALILGLEIVLYFVWNKF